MGDSITYGHVSEPIGPSYATLVAGDLADTHEVVNASRGGLSAYYWAPGVPCPIICEGADTVFDWLAAPELPAQIASVLLGTNDALGFFLPERTPVDDWEGYMRALVDGLFQGGVESVILMTSPDANVSAEAAALLHGYSERTDEICADTAGVICGPDLSELLDPVADFATNDVHPNGAGNAKIANALVGTILAVPEPDPRGLLGLGLASSLLASDGRRRRANACGPPPRSPRAA